MIQSPSSNPSLFKTSNLFITPHPSLPNSTFQTLPPDVSLRRSCARPTQNVPPPSRGIATLVRVFAAIFSISWCLAVTGIDPTAWFFVSEWFAHGASAQKHTSTECLGLNGRVSAWSTWFGTPYVHQLLVPNFPRRLALEREVCLI